MPRFIDISSFDAYDSLSNPNHDPTPVSDIYIDEGTSSVAYTIESIIGTGTTSGETETTITGASVTLSVDYTSFKTSTQFGSAYTRSAVGFDVVKDQYPNGVVLTDVTSTGAP